MSEEIDADTSDYADPLIPAITRETLDGHFEREAQRNEEYRARTSYLTAHRGSSARTG